MTDLAVIILVGREELHIGRCLDRLKGLEPRQVFVVESQPGDRTHEIAVAKGATTFFHDWPGTQARQFNWALDHLPLEAEWILRLDADEYLLPETIAEVKARLPTLDADVTSLSLSLARAWMGTRVRRGVGAVILKRFFRRGAGRCEERLMDEHIVTTRGRDLLLKGAFVDDNLNDLAWWTRKHLDYARREALDLLRIEYGNETVDAGLGGPTAAKRAQKLKYARLPLFWRSFAYFCYRYFLRGGFLEGRAGFTWHFFQGWWYRALVDARVLEIKKSLNNDPVRIRAYLDDVARAHGLTV